LAFVVAAPAAAAADKPKPAAPKGGGAAKPGDWVGSDPAKATAPGAGVKGAPVFSPKGQKLKE
jgi:hypothetical protein